LEQSAGQMKRQQAHSNYATPASCTHIHHCQQYDMLQLLLKALLGCCCCRCVRAAPPASYGKPADSLCCRRARPLD
jgi:hypothetical protein